LSKSENNDKGGGSLGKLIGENIFLKKKRKKENIRTLTAVNL
jgi:hypothetical protein